MNGWFYSRSGWFGDRDIGPLSDSAFLALISDGTLTAKSRVRHPINTRDVWILVENLPAGREKIAEREQFVELTLIERFAIEQLDQQPLPVSNFKCPFCGTNAPPRIASKVSTGGWVIFVLLFLVMCWPFFLLALLIRDDYRVCSVCGIKLG